MSPLTRTITYLFDSRVTIEPTAPKLRLRIFDEVRMYSVIFAPANNPSKGRSGRGGVIGHPIRVAAALVDAHA